MGPRVETWKDRLADMRRAFSAFLAIPTLVVLIFVLLALGTYMVDRNPPSWMTGMRSFLKARLVVSSDATTAVLQSVAGGLITVTSITFSLLLLAVQQSAASFTTQVLDQFVRRRENQLYFGGFVGIALYALLILATTDTRVQPVFGEAFTLVLTATALLMLVLLLYTTLNQMREDRIIQAVHDLTLVARDSELDLLSRTRRETIRGAAGDAAAVSRVVRARSSGYVAGIQLEPITRAARELRGRPEVEMLVPMGAYVSYHDAIARVRTDTEDDACRLETAVLRGVSLERQRDYRSDAGYGVMQLANIGWTSISSSKSNPAPGIASIRMLRDLLARWAGQELPERAAGEVAPVVYTDHVATQVMDALESLGVAASESMQHQSIAEVFIALAVLFERLSPTLQERAEAVTLRLISSLGDQVLTGLLDRSMTSLTATLRSADRTTTAAALERAHSELGTTVGVLNSRATRVPDSN